MSQSENGRRAEEAKARAKAEAARGRELSDAELEAVAAAGDVGSNKGDGTPPSKPGPK